MPGPIIDALDLAEDAILAALAALAPLAVFEAAPEDTTRRLRLPAAHVEALSHVYVAQHQDNGGRRADYAHSSGWQGLIAVRCISASDAAARAGRNAAHAALTSLASPAGYHLSATYRRPIPTTIRNGVAQRGGVYQVTIRRVATP